MDNARKHFEAWAIFRHMAPSIKERIIRLNLSPVEGKRIRGFFRKPLSWRKVKKRLQSGGVVPMGAFRIKGGAVKYGIETGPVNLDKAERYGWFW